MGAHHVFRVLRAFVVNSFSWSGLRGSIQGGQRSSDLVPIPESASLCQSPRSAVVGPRDHLGNGSPPRFRDVPPHVSAHDLPRVRDLATVLIASSDRRIESNGVPPVQTTDLQRPDGATTVPVGIRRSIQPSGLDDLDRLEDTLSLDGNRFPERTGREDDGDGEDQLSDGEHGLF